MLRTTACLRVASCQRQTPALPLRGVSAQSQTIPLRVAALQGNFFYIYFLLRDEDLLIKLRSELSTRGKQG